ncbi:MAG TPA: hypothetical protein VN241_03275 [Microbacterium sp.]|nr:hypothetical protein [Microbacterium sp.]
MTARRARIIGGAVALVVLLGAGVWIWLAASRPSTPAQSAASFLRALESGDVGAVEATGITAPQSALDAFTGASTLIEQGEVERIDEDGDRAAATVSFHLAGDAHTATILLSHADGRWVVDDSTLGSLTATTTMGSFVAIGEAVVGSGDDVALLPATYTVEAAPTELLSGEAAIVVLPGRATETIVEGQLREVATAAAQAELDRHLETCTAPVTGEKAPDACGIRIPWGADLAAVTGIRFRIERLPTLSLEGTSFHADDGALVATVSGTALDGRDASFTYRTDTWSVRGDVTFTADDLQLSVW